MTAPGWWVIPGAVLGAVLWVLVGMTLFGPMARIIDHDPGGRVGARAALIRTIGPVEIRGYCASACTLHLANGCVHPGAVLVFHGPQVSDPDAFDHWSAVMARHYPPEIAAWFMEQGRYRTSTVTGAWAIQRGATAC